MRTMSFFGLKKNKFAELLSIHEMRMVNKKNFKLIIGWNQWGIWWKLKGFKLVGKSVKGMKTMNEMLSMG